MKFRQCSWDRQAQQLESGQGPGWAAEFTVRGKGIYPTPARKAWADPSLYLELAQLELGCALTHNQHVLQIHRSLDVLPAQLLKATQLEA